ncbi:exodeoxyribonuclease IX [candidate division KSB1 bacterium]|nr:MAG: exodeoxyribonuclease IX [candidate division KSB1 bacterium]
MPPIYLIDASPYIFRAYFSIPGSIRTPEGAPANAVYGYTAFLLDLLKREQPSHLAVAFDGSLTTSFRNEIYPAYKAQRELPPAELEAQLDACWEVTKALGMAAYIDDRFEADDIIGTLIAKLAKHEGKFVVVSGDKDLAQLVNKRVTLWDFAKDRRFDEKAVKQHFGVRPNQIIDLLALMGDAVDNIPGVKGIGEKTAVALLEKFASIEDIFEKLERVEKMAVRGAAGIRAKLEQGREHAFLSKDLATISTKAPVKANLRALQYNGADRQQVEALFDRLGFGKIRERIPQWKSGGNQK